MVVGRRSRSASATPRRSSRRSTLNPEEDRENKDEEYTEDNIQLDDDDLEVPADEDDDDEFEDQPVRKRPKRSSSIIPKEEIDDLQDDLVEEENDEAAEGQEQPQVKQKKRGRPPLPKPQHHNEPEESVDYEIVDDECVVPLDEEGETKITKDGVLQGDRKFRVRTFTVTGRGNRLYMLSTEPARCVGFRDSYLLFQKHRRLHKIILSSEEKFDLIEREIIPHSYKGRVIGLVTARSIFMEFGAKIIVGGKTIIDDYYVKELRAKGVKEGELADPSDKFTGSGTNYNTNQFVAWHGASSLYIHGIPAGAAQASNPELMALDSGSIESKSIRALRGTESAINEENWMYIHSQAVRDTDLMFLNERANNMRGAKDNYTGITFVPQSTQPTRVKYLKEENEDDKDDDKSLSYKTVIHSNNLFKITGLKDVDLGIFDDCVSEEVKEAILRQQKLERNNF